MNASLAIPEDPHDIQTYRVRSYECAPDGRVRLSHLCNYLQESASIHAQKLGFSKQNLDPLGLTWVLTRMRVRVFNYPTWGEPVVVLTYPRNMRKLTAYRDFVLSRPDGSPIGIATSEWMTMNQASRRVARLPDFIGAYSNTVRPCVWTEGEPFERLEFPNPDTSTVATDLTTRSFTVQQAQIDLNEHVNNVHYIEWMMECAPEMTEGHRVCDLHVVFREEARYGESITAQCLATAAGSRLHQLTNAQGQVLTLAQTHWH